MGRCIHNGVCRYTGVDPCGSTEICKFYGAGSEPKTKKRGNACKKRAADLNPADIKGVKKARAFLVTAKREGRLTDSQKKALSVYEGKFIKKLTEEQRQQIIDMFNDLSLDRQE